MPVYDDVVVKAREGVVSTLLSENLARLALLRGDLDKPGKAILFDPQTSGGLLARIPAKAAAECVSELQSAGHARAAMIGLVRQIGLGRTGASVLVTGSLARQD